MKLFSLLLAGCFLSLSSLAAETLPIADEYFVNDQQIEQLFQKSEDISLSSSASVLTSPAENTMAANKAYYAAGDKNFATALLLNFFLGGLGIHRAYLGTKTLTWVGYILTCGGIAGIVPLVDFITLIIHNDDISPYVDNPKFFMWSGKDD